VSIGETVLTVVGNLTADPELTRTENGVSRLTFTVASNTRVWDKDTAAWTEGRTLFMRCTAWRWTADNAHQTLTRGARVIVTGALRQFETVTADGSPRTGYGLDVEEVGPSLRYATATVQRTATGNGSTKPKPVPGAGTPGNPWATSRRSGPAPVDDDPWAADTPALAGGAGFSDEPPF
jgi:single-strand DNA-binding protein